MKKQLFVFILVCLLGNLYGVDIQKVTVTYTAGGVSKSLDVMANTTKSISRDKGTAINIRIYKSTTAPATSTFTISCFPTGGGYERTSTNASELFNNVGDALTNDIWCMVNVVSGVIKIQPVDLPSGYADLSPVNRAVDGSVSSSYKEFTVGQTVDVECDIWNNGQVAAEAHRTGFYIGTSSSDYSVRFDYNTTGSTPIQPSYIEHESSTYTFAATDIGTRYINFWADYQDVIEEGTAEGNNKQSWGPFTVKEVPLSVDVSQPSSNISVTKGQMINITWTGSGTNAASVSLRRDKDNIWENNTDETWIAISQPVSGTYTWDTKDVPEGTYYIAAAIFNTSTYSFDYASGIVTINPPTSIKDWTTVNSNGIDYVIQIKSSGVSDLSNRIISMENCDLVDAVSIFSIQNGQRILVEDQSVLLPILTLAANKVILQNTTDPARYNSISNADIQYINDVLDKNGNQYRISSLLDLSNNERLIRDPLINFNGEGTDYYQNRYKGYSEVINSIVYHIDEDQINSFFKEYATVLDDIGRCADAIDLGSSLTEQSFVAIKTSMLNALKPTSGIFTINNTLNQTKSLDRYINFLEKFGLVVNIIQSAQVITSNQIKLLFQYLLLSEVTELKIETLSSAINKTSTSFKDVALVNAIKDVRYNFYDRYNKSINGDWTLLLNYIKDSGATFVNKSFPELAFIWAGFGAAQLGPMAYLFYLPIAAEKSLINSRDKFRCSIFSTNIHEILYLSIKDRYFESNQEDINITFYGAANNLMYISAYIAYNYVADYLGDPLVYLATYTHFLNSQEACNYYNNTANTALNFYNNSGAPWYFSGTPEAAFNQTCLAGKLSTSYLEAEKISAPILSVTKTILVKGESTNLFANGAVSNHNSQLTYEFDFGDGNLSSWSSNSITHVYNTPGSYFAKAKARSQTNNLIESPWSNSVEIKVTDLETLTKPETPIAFDIVNIKQQFNVNTAGSISSIGSQLEYKYNWGNGYYSSWGTSARNYAFEYPGTYNIYVRARSKSNPIILSDWSNYKTIVAQDLSTNIENINLSVRVFPNPVSGILNIEYRNKDYETINILNSSGTLMGIKKAIPIGQQLDFSKYKSGLYMLEFVKSSGEVMRIKVIKR